MNIEQYKIKYNQLIGDWRIEKEIGKGSYGRVFEITRVEKGATLRAALKIITIPQNEDEAQSIIQSLGLTEENAISYFQGMVDELKKEIALMADLKDNSNIVNYFDHRIIKYKDKLQWDILIMMELLTPFENYRKSYKLSEEDVVKLGKDICNALISCSQRKIIHRDIKPDNIFVSDSGEYKLGDFGEAKVIEKATGASTKRGADDYMAPEVYKGEKYNSTVDIYSLGIVMYRLLNGDRLPFFPPAGRSISYTQRNEAFDKRMNGIDFPLLENVSSELTNIILKACKYDPTERYPTPRQMFLELKRLLPEEGNEEEREEGEREEEGIAGGDIKADKPKQERIFCLNDALPNIVFNDDLYYEDMNIDTKSRVISAKDIWLMNFNYSGYGYIKIFNWYEKSANIEEECAVFGNNYRVFVSYSYNEYSQASKYLFWIDKKGIINLLGLVKPAISWDYEYRNNQGTLSSTWEIECIVDEYYINSRGSDRYPQKYTEVKQEILALISSYIKKLEYNVDNKRKTEKKKIQVEDPITASANEDNPQIPRKTRAKNKLALIIPISLAAIFLVTFGVVFIMRYYGTLSKDSESSLPDEKLSADNKVVSVNMQPQVQDESRNKEKTNEETVRNEFEVEIVENNNTDGEKVETQSEEGREEPIVDVFSTEWSDWAEVLPAKIDREQYDIDKKTQYSYRRATESYKTIGYGEWGEYKDTDDKKVIDNLLADDEVDIEYSIKSETKQHFLWHNCGYNKDGEYGSWYSSTPNTRYHEYGWIDDGLLNEEFSEALLGSGWSYYLGKDYFNGGDMGPLCEDGIKGWYCSHKNDRVLTLYTYRTRSFKREKEINWSEWTEYTDDSIETDESCEVRKRELYRFKLKSME